MLQQKQNVNDVFVLPRYIQVSQRCVFKYQWLLLNKAVRIEQTCLLSPNIVQITSREYGWAMTCWSSFVWGFNSSYQGMKKCTTNHNNMKQVVLAVLWGLTSLKSQHFVKKKRKRWKKRGATSVFSLFLSTTGKRVFQTGCLLYLLSAFYGTEICQIFAHLQIVLHFLLYEYKYQSLVKTMHMNFFSFTNWIFNNSRPF